MQFNQQGLKVLQAGSRRPHKTAAKFSDECAEKLKEILRQSPQKFGQETSLWTLALLAKVSYENHLVESLVSVSPPEQTRLFGCETCHRFSSAPTMCRLRSNYAQEKYRSLRAKGHTDCEAPQEVSNNLGHNRLDVVKGYIPL